MTPYYQDDLVTIYHGDAEEVTGDERWLVRRPVEVFNPSTRRVITDPPYGTSSYAFDTAIPGLLGFLEGLADPIETVAVFGYPELLVKWCVQERQYPTEWIVWWPTNKNVSRGPNLPKESEHVAIFGEMRDARKIVRPRSANASGRQIALSRGDDPEWARDGDVWRDPTPAGHFNAADRLHPNEKPVSLMQKLVVLCSDESDTVVDPFMGSGTTLVAAKSLNRHAIGIEAEEKWCEIAAQRCSQEVLGLAV